MQLRDKDTRNVDALNFDLTKHASFNYAKARYAIHADAQRIARSNVARSRTWMRWAKGQTIEFLGGTCNRGTKEVVFPDGTKAKY